MARLALALALLALIFAGATLIKALSLAFLAGMVAGLVLGMALWFKVGRRCNDSD